jgi:hypothetical protein
MPSETLTTRTPDGGDATGSPPTAASVAQALYRLMDAAQTCRNYAAMDAIAAVNQSEVVLPTAEVLDPLIQEITTDAISKPHQEAARKLEAASTEFRNATEAWTFFRTVSPRSDQQVDQARASQSEYFRARTQLLKAVEDAEELFGPNTSRRSPTGTWLREHVRNPRSWTGLLAAIGVALFALIRLVDLAVYSPFGVDPDEVGRDSIASIPHAITLGIAMGIFGISLTYFFGAIVGGAQNTVESWRRFKESRSGKNETGVDHAIDARKTDKSESAQQFLIGFLTIVALLVLGAIFVDSARDDISTCEADAPLDYAVLGIPTSRVKSISPRPDGAAQGELVAYLGTGPTHVVLFNCDTESVVRLPKGGFVVVTGS